MSLILEALRRSEAERRRAGPPSLLGDGAPPRPRQRSPWPIALGGLLIGLLIAGALALALLRDRPSAAPPEVPAPAAAPPARTEVAPTLDRVPAAAYATLPPAASPPPASMPAPVPSPAPSPAITPPSTTAPPAATAAPAAPTPPSPGADPATGPQSGDLPLDALVGAQREALPPLRLSMHVYAEDPSRRFAIVDGQRLREGDALGGGLQVLAIQRDGLRLAWNGRVLWVPR